MTKAWNLSEISSPATQSVSGLQAVSEKTSKEMSGDISDKPSDIYLFKVNSGNTRIIWEICSKLKIHTSRETLLMLH